MRHWLAEYWGVFAAAVFLLLVLLPFLDYYGLWFDEIFSVVMSRSFDSIVQMVRNNKKTICCCTICFCGCGSRLAMAVSFICAARRCYWCCCH